MHGIHLSVNSLASLIAIMPLFRKSSRDDVSGTGKTLQCLCLQAKWLTTASILVDQKSLSQIDLMFLTVLFISWSHIEGYKKRLKLCFLLQYYDICALSATVTKHTEHTVCAKKHQNMLISSSFFAHNCIFRQQLKRVVLLLWLKMHAVISRKVIRNARSSTIWYNANSFISI